MPWQCSECSATIEQDDLACPSCQAPKTSWTLVADATRTFVVAARKVELLRAGQPAREAPAVSRARAARGDLPADQLLTIRLHPRAFADLTVTLGIGYGMKMFEELALPVERPADLPADGHVDVPVLLVYGPGDDPQPAHPGVHVVDIGEETEAGFAPDLEVTALRKRPLEVPVVGAQEARRGYRLEVADLHFHHGSAVVLPSAEAGGLAVLRAAREQAARYPERRLLVAGHTDTTGSDAVNVELSRLRAESVHALLLGDRERFVEIAAGRHETEDVQQILSWLAGTEGWSCDPGPVDGLEGPKTKAGVETFQREYNAAWGSSIAVDGVVGPQTWGAVFDVYRRACADDGADPTFLEPAFVGCGEAHPLEAAEQDELRSQTNRRVELVFFDPEEAPDRLCQGEACAPGQCPLYDPARYTLEWLRYDVGDGLEDLHLEVLDRAGRAVVEAAVEVAGRELRTDARGRVLVPDLEPGHYEVAHDLGRRSSPTFRKGSEAVQVYLQGAQSRGAGGGRPRREEPRGVPDEELDDPNAPLSPPGWGEDEE